MILKHYDNDKTQNSVVLELNAYPLREKGCEMLFWESYREKLNRAFIFRFFVSLVVNKVLISFQKP